MITRNRKYTNGEITVIWQPALCVHAGVCFTRLRRVFNPVKRPWVDMSGGTTREIIDVVEECPTDALTFFWNDPVVNAASGSPKIFSEDLGELFPPESDAIARVIVRNGGPLVVEGHFSATGPDGEPMRKMRLLSLCRCGLSQDQPFCDGSHFRARFKD